MSINEGLVNEPTSLTADRGGNGRVEIPDCIRPIDDELQQMLANGAEDQRKSVEGIVYCLINCLPSASLQIAQVYRHSQKTIEYLMRFGE